MADLTSRKQALAADLAELRVYLDSARATLRGLPAPASRNATGTSAQAYRLSSGLWVPMGSPSTTNIPLGSGRETGYGHIIYRLAGTTARTVTSDYQTARVRFTSLR